MVTIARPAVYARLPRQRGYAMLLALGLVLLVAMGSLLAVDRIQLNLKRDNERQLLWVGDQYRKALRSYQRASPDGQQLPRRLEDLLEDRRGPLVKRHLRQLYPDPMTKAIDWVFVMQGDQIAGVHSRSTAAPLKRSAFPAPYGRFAMASSYRDWRFEPADEAMLSAGPGEGRRPADPPPAVGSPAPAPPSEPPGQGTPGGLPSTPPDPATGPTPEPLPRPVDSPSEKPPMTGDAERARRQACIDQFIAPRTVICSTEASQALAVFRQCMDRFLRLYQQCIGGAG